MPTLLGFLACEKVITDKDSNSTSLINVLHDVFIPVLRSKPVPDKAMAPINWVAAAIWYRIPEDAGIWFEQKVVLMGESEEELVDPVVLRFLMEKPVMRCFSYFTHFPVYKPIRLSLRLYWRTLGISPPETPTAQWVLQTEYPITLNHTYL